MEDAALHLILELLINSYLGIEQLRDCLCLNRIWHKIVNKSIKWHAVKRHGLEIKVFAQVTNAKSTKISGQIQRH